MATQQDQDLQTRVAVLLEERRAELHSTVSGLLAEMLGIDAVRVAPDGVLLDLGAQSFDFVELVIRLERIYGIHIPRVYAVPDTYTPETFVRVIAEGLAARERKAPADVGVGSGGV